MADLKSIYIANGVGVFILLLLHFTSRTKILRNHAEDKLYSYMVFGVMIGCIMEALSYTIDGLLFPGSRFINYVINTYLYSVNLLLPFCVLIYVDLGLYHDPSRIRKHYKPQIFTLIAMLLLTCVNFFVPIVYYITEDNVYERRPLSYVYYFAILFFLITAVIMTRRYEKKFGARPFFSIHLFLLPIVLGVGLQFLFYGLSLAWLSAAIGLVGLYMMQQNETAYIDPLSDTYNRQYLNHILSRWTKRGNSFAGAMIDVDRFKTINDKFGHSEGDKALITISQMLKTSQLENEWVFRFAGDEFIVLKMTEEKDGLDQYMEEVLKKLEEYNRQEKLYPLSISYGMSFFESGDIDVFMREIDTNMYLMKAEHHKTM